MRTLTVVLTLLAWPLFAADETCPAPWSYPEGPAWGADCAAATPQSPIRNVASQRTQASLPPLQLNYISGLSYPVTMKNTSVDLKVTPMFDGRLIVGSQYGRLTQFHFHVPAEHDLDVWANAKAELHLVHESPQHEVFVIAVPINLGASNPAIAALQRLGSLAACRSATSVGEGQLVQMKALLPAETKRYITYVGSLTTPPCSGKVRFFLMNDAITATQEQINFLKVLASGNARGIKANSNPVLFQP
jgi:carbonic anhydrase